MERWRWVTADCMVHGVARAEEHVLGLKAARHAQVEEAGDLGVEAADHLGGVGVACLRGAYPRANGLEAVACEREDGREIG